MLAALSLNTFNRPPNKTLTGQTGQVLGDRTTGSAPQPSTPKIARIPPLQFFDALHARRHKETTKTTTFECLDNGKGERYFYSEVTTTVTTGNVVKIDPKGGSATTPPNIDIKAYYERIPTMQETNQGYDEQETSKSKYSDKSWGFLGLRG